MKFYVALYKCVRQHENYEVLNLRSTVQEQCSVLKTAQCLSLSPNIWAKHMRQRAAAAHRRKRSSISSAWQSKVIYPYLISLHIVKQCLCEHTAWLEQAAPQTARTPAAPLCWWSWRGRSSPLLPHRCQGPGTPPDPGPDSAGQRAGSTHRSQD